jgi:ssDNA-binding Zn-finger/Zn-ribbon topoisomerase 1
MGADYDETRICNEGHLMILRTNRKTGQQFYGCTKWPECDETEPAEDEEPWVSPIDYS